jgi:hypothetical protein
MTMSSQSASRSHQERFGGFSSGGAVETTKTDEVIGMVEIAKAIETGRVAETVEAIEAVEAIGVRGTAKAISFEIVKTIGIGNDVEPLLVVWVVGRILMSHTPHEPVQSNESNSKRHQDIRRGETVKSVNT